MGPISESKMRIADHLYRHEKGMPVKSSRDERGKPFAVGDSLPQGVGISAARPAGYSNGVVISCAALLLDALLKTPSIRAVRIAAKRAVYCEISGTKILAEENTLHEEAWAYPVHAVFACMIWELAYGKNHEFASSFKNCVTAFNNRGYVSATDLALLCDSFYFGIAKLKTVEVLDDLNYPMITGWIKQGKATEIYSLGKCTQCASAIDTILYGGSTEETTPTPDQNALRNNTHPDNSAIPKKKRQKQREKTNELRPVADADEPSKSAEENQNSKEEQLKEACISGTYLVDYDWDDHVRNAIRPMGSFDDYVITPSFEKLLKKISFRTGRITQRMRQMEEKIGEIDPIAAMGKDVLNINLVGEPGTGKTLLVYKVAEYTGMPVFTISCSRNMQEDDLGCRAMIVDGKPCMVPTDVLTCFEYGGICLLEEFNLASAGVIMGALGQAVEFPYVMKTEGNRTVHRHPLCIFIGCMNTGTSGSQIPSEAYTNRFPIVFRMNAPGKERFIEMLMASTGEAENICSWVYGAYERILAFLEEERAAADIDGIKLTLSLRTCKGAVQNIQEGWEPRDAVRDSIIGKIAERDPSLADRCDKLLETVVRDPEF